MKLSRFSRVISFSLATALAGCATSGSDQENQLLNHDLSASAQQTLATQTLCCNDLNQVTYVPFSTGKKLINATSPAMQFDSGKSYFYAAKIDDQSLGKAISIHTPVGKTVFPLQVILLKADHQISRALPFSVFSATNYTEMSSPELKAEIQLFPEERFMMVYADNRMMGKSIKISHPEKLKEKATGIVAQPYPDLDIPFSPWGVVEIQTASNNALNKLFSSDPILSSRNATTELAPAPTVTAVTPQASGVAVTASSQTQHYYQEAIQQAVKNNQIEQAMQLVAEAEKLGLTDAKNIFVDAVKQK